MALQVAELSIELIETLRPLMPRIKARDKSLEDQIRRAASSIVSTLEKRSTRTPGIGARGSSRRRGARGRR
jgi:hypothetical protein